MSATARVGTGGSATPLPVGTVVATRFRIQGFLRTEGGTDVYQALDSQGGASVVLRILSQTPQARAVLESDLGKVARLKHKNLTQLAAVGDFAGMLYIATESEDGHSLRELVDAQRTQGKTVGLPYARTLLGHIANALDGGTSALAHGGLNPACIWITRAGRVKVSDLGLTRGLPAMARRGSPAGAPEGLYLAPEVARGGPPSVVADVYSLGAILYELCTGVPPASPLRAPSQVASDLPPAIDGVIARALAPSPPARFATPAELIAGLGAALGEGNPAASSSAAAPKINIGRSFDVAQAAGMTDSDERWLIQKDRLDYGPFSMAQVTAQIEKGIFKADHYIVDVDSGERQKIKEHPLLGEYALESERRLEKVRRAQAEQVHETVERKKSRASLIIIGGAVLLATAAVAVYLTQRKAASDDELASRIGDEDVDQFLKAVKLNFTPARKPASVRRTASGGGKADEFNNTTNMGDVTQGGGDDVLSDNKVQQVMMGNYRKLIPCIMQERHRNPGLSDIDLEFVIQGSGKVSAVKANGQINGTFPACVLGRMQTFGFPSFNGKKTVASWSLSMK
jgi:serine/threonine protein kinase